MCNACPCACTRSRKTRKMIQHSKTRNGFNLQASLFVHKHTHDRLSSRHTTTAPARSASGAQLSHTISDHHHVAISPPQSSTIPTSIPGPQLYTLSSPPHARSSTSVAASTTGARARCPHATAQLLRITMHEIYPRSAVVNKAHAPAFGAIATRNMSSCACSVERAACRSLRRASRQPT